MAGTFETDFRMAVGKIDRELAKSRLLTGFARLYAGGAMAIAAGVMPWQPAELNAALIACLKVAHRHVAQNMVPLTTLQRQLRQRLQQADLIAHPAKGTFGPAERVGFCRMERGTRIYTIHGKSFRDWFATRAQRVAVLRWLHDAGHLRMGERASRPSSSSTDWAERTVRWPDGRVHRSYVFRSPFAPAPGSTIASTRVGAA
jgi:hypothetical protein